MIFSEYTTAGWKLCAISPGTKGPHGAQSLGWNLLPNAITDAAAADRLKGAGLCHAWSKTCAVDVDDYAHAEIYLHEQGIDLGALFDAPGAVQISSGRPNHGKLLYGLSEPLPTLKLAGGALELRCMARTGGTMQDVLPPTVHPETNTPYKWIGDWRKIPALPTEMYQLWTGLLSPYHTSAEKSVTELLDSANGNGNGHASLKTLRDLLSRKDPSCGYDDWIKAGMAIHDSTGGSDEGFALWEEWSVPSGKYPGVDTLRSHWLSFGRSKIPTTINGLLQSDVAAVEDFDAVLETTREKQVAPEFAFLTLAELFSRPEPDWIVKGLLPEASVGAIWGQPSSGKTFMAVDIALAVALGLSWRGLPAKRGGVLYIAAEDDSGVQMRFQSSLAAHGATEAPVRVLPAAPVFTSPKTAEALLKAVAALGKQSLVFVDTLAAVTPGADENTAKDMGLMIQFCEKIHKVTGALVLLVHHEGKTVGKGMRGSSLLVGAMNVAINISDEDGCRELQVTKQKNAALGFGHGFQLVPHGSSCSIEWL